VEAPVYDKIKPLAMVANEGQLDDFAIPSAPPGTPPVGPEVINPGPVINPGQPVIRRPTINIPRLENRSNPLVTPALASPIIATQPGRIVGETTLMDRLNRQANLSRQAAVRVESLLQTNRAIPQKVTGISAEEQIYVNFRQVKVFHEGLVAAKRIPPIVPKIDFHRMIAMLGQYPELMRRLGLVIDLDLGIPAAPPSPAAAPKSVFLKWTAPTTNESAKTRYVATPTFAAALRVATSEKNGMLPLGDPSYLLLQVDIDSAAIKTMEFASNVVRAEAQLAAARTEARTKSVRSPLAASASLTASHQAHLAAATATQPSLAGAPALRSVDHAQLLVPAAATEAMIPKAGPPPLQSAGLSVVHVNRALSLRDRLNTARQLNNQLKSATEDATLYREDLVRGYRVDVWDNKSQQWHSLCRRVGTYNFLNAAPGKQTLQIEDEGFVQMGATQAPDKADSDLHLHEVLFRWAGWSLCAPRPGKAISEDNVPVDAAPKATTEFKLETTFQATKGSLPRLRFGVEYRMRARVVDLAGNSLPHTHAGDFSTATPPLVYKRFEPVSWPMIVLREAVKNAQDQQLPGKEGESVERLVIRSFNDAPAKDTQKTDQDTERHIVPPKTSQVMAETLGIFDTPPGPDPAAYTPASKGPSPNAYNVIVAKDASVKDVEPGATLPVPYLPDPLARGATLKGLPGMAPGAIKQVPYAGAWPNEQAFRLHVEEGTGTPQLAGGVLTVFLPKAEAIRVHISSYLDDKDLDLSGHWQWIDEKKPANLSDLRSHAYQGCHWIFTPCRELVLVHAVQQPLITPDLKDLKPVRSLGQTFATVQDQFPISGKSTVRIDVKAEWDEPVDNPRDPNNNPATDRLSGKATLEDLRVEADDTTANLSQRHEFHDTKHRRVRYQAVATTRFREYFGPAIINDPKNITRSSAWKEISVPNAARPDAPKVLYVVPMFKWEKGATSKTRRGGLRVYLERPWFSSGDGELLGVVFWPGPSFGKIPDKFRPYVTQWGSDPIWSTSPPDGTAKADNFKNAIAKDYNLTLDELQPQLSAIGSLGGAILRPGPSFRINPQFDPRLARATDRILAPGAIIKPPTGTTPATAAGPAIAKPAVSIGEIISQDRIAVAGHKVEYDEERKLWFCDIDLDAGDSYFPFVRLALARYQPNSVPDAHLSRVILADFAQLTP
ncbi:MAG: hypothetical protein M3347_07615, partial [Armatimonadota bacterium]|nr:hypothetical protein [Armatimonadota bacterium]